MFLSSSGPSPFVLAQLTSGSGPAGQGTPVFLAVLQGGDGHPLRKERRGGGELSEYVHITVLMSTTHNVVLGFCCCILGLSSRR